MYDDRLPWMVWSSASESALADAFRFAGGPVPDRGLVLGRGAARMRTVHLGGLLKRSIWRSAAGAGEGDDVHLYMDSSAAFLLDLRRRLKIYHGCLGWCHPSWGLVGSGSSSIASWSRHSG